MRNPLAMLMFICILTAAGPYGQPEKVGEIQSKVVDEASGLACSHKTTDLWWTHNDSGDGPFLYALGPHGEDRGRLELQGVFALDWEDMCSFTLNGKPYLLAADIGDNMHLRRRYTLYIFPEPDPPGENHTALISSFHTLLFEYPADRAYNCEAVAVDPTTRTIYLITKRWYKDDDVPTRIFRLPLPDLAQPAGSTVTAEQIGELDMKMVTAMDISPDGRRAAVLALTHLYEFSRRPDEDWAAAFKRPPRELPCPQLRQGEAVAYGPDGVTLRLTSEQRPAPIYQLSPNTIPPQ